jgi:cellulose synthase/poly-beta-1,6-N-acetylglucosamine synthase-like glycosyltransferase
MAFPWDVIRSANLATNSIVEDLKLGLELAIVGKPPVFCPTAVVTSVFPSSPEGLQSQRLRWEGGHLGLIVTQVPYLILAALRRRNWPLLVLALDASVPPLSLLGMLVVGTSGLAGISWVLGATSTAFVLSLVNLAAFAVVLFVCWSKYGRDVVTPRIAIGIAWYVLKKGLLYLRLLLGMRVGRWVRTDRGRL